MRGAEDLPAGSRVLNSVGGWFPEMAQAHVEAYVQTKAGPLGLAVGDVMPTHAFTRGGVLLLACGEPISSSSQVERLGHPDVVFSDNPPPSIQAAIEIRLRRAISPLGPPGGLLPRLRRLPH